MPLISRQTGPIAIHGATGDLGLDAPAVAARVDDPASLRSLLSDCAAVINCAGSFRPSRRARATGGRGDDDAWRSGEAASLAPSQAFEPTDFLAGLERFQLRRQADQSERRVPVEA
jgi:hypothetical protein